MQGIASQEKASLLWIGEVIRQEVLFQLEVIKMLGLLIPTQKENDDGVVRFKATLPLPVSGWPIHWGRKCFFPHMGSILEKECSLNQTLTQN